MQFYSNSEEYVSMSYMLGLEVSVIIEISGFSAQMNLGGRGFSWAM